MRHLIDKYNHIFFRIFNDKNNWLCYEIAPLRVDGELLQPSIYDNCKLRFYNSIGSIDNNHEFLYKPIDSNQNNLIHTLNNTLKTSYTNFNITVKIYVVLANNNSDVFMYRDAPLYEADHNTPTYYTSHSIFDKTVESIRSNIQLIVKTNRIVEYELSSNEFSIVTLKYGISELFNVYLLGVDIDPDFSDINDNSTFSNFHHDFFTSFLKAFVCNDSVTISSDWIIIF